MGVSGAGRPGSRRIVPQSSAIIKRASGIEGRSVSDFAFAAAQDAAARAIEEAQIIRHSAEDQRALAKAIPHTPEPV
ncbi:MAG TPA: DUF1778 domain-containing protein [Methylocella sp.]|nr:DUF1778 domain-containing protein [Methylocella sp.]